MANISPCLSPAKTTSLWSFVFLLTGTGMIWQQLTLSLFFAVMLVLKVTDISMSPSQKLCGHNMKQVHCHRELMGYDCWKANLKWWEKESCWAQSCKMKVMGSLVLPGTTSNKDDASMVLLGCVSEGRGVVKRGCSCPLEPKPSCFAV